MLRRLMTLLTAALVLALSVESQAQPKAPGDFPSKPIRIVVPFPPGGTNDILARLVAAKLTEQRAWTVIVENRPGAGSAIGAAHVAGSPPDGYTLLAISASHAVVGAVQKVPYDPVKSFTAIALLGSGPNVLTVTPSLPVNSIADLIALAKAKPGQLTYASSGIGSLTHLMGEMFNLAAQTNILHVAYKGGSPAVNDLIAGHVHVFYGGLASVVQLIRSGKMKVLGVTTRERSPAAPDIPAIAETVPGFDAANWYGVIGPAGMPPPVVAELNAAINAILRDPEVAARMTGEGIVPTAVSSEPAAKFLADDVSKWAAVAKAARITAQ